MNTRKWRKKMRKRSTREAKTSAHKSSLTFFRLVGFFAANAFMFSLAAHSLLEQECTYSFAKVNCEKYAYLKNRCEFLVFLLFFFFLLLHSTGGGCSMFFPHERKTTQGKWCLTKRQPLTVTASANLASEWRRVTRLVCKQTCDHHLFGCCQPMCMWLSHNPLRFLSVVAACTRMQSFLL